MFIGCVKLSNLNKVSRRNSCEILFDTINIILIIAKMLEIVDAVIKIQREYEQRYNNYYFICKSKFTVLALNCN